MVFSPLCDVTFQCKSYNISNTKLKLFFAHENIKNCPQNKQTLWFSPKIFSTANRPKTSQNLIFCSVKMTHGQCDLHIMTLGAHMGLVPAIIFRCRCWTISNAFTFTTTTKQQKYVWKFAQYIYMDSKLLAPVVYFAKSSLNQFMGHLSRATRIVPWIFA